MSWLKKLLEGLNGGAAMAGSVPLHGATPDPTKLPYAQTQLPMASASAPPITQPYNAVPGMQPTNVTGNVSKQSPILQVLDNLGKDNMPQDTPLNGREDFESQLEAKRKEYADVNAAPAKHQNPWLQAAFLALQGVQRGLDPQRGRNLPPMEWLGNAKKADKVGRLGQDLTGLEAVNTKRRSDINQNVLWEDRREDNRRQIRNVERQEKRDILKGELDRDRLDFNIDTAGKIQVWRERKLDAEIENNEVKVKQAQQKIDELIRNHKATEEGRNTRSEITQEGQTRRAEQMMNFKTALGDKIKKEKAIGKLDALKYRRMLAQDLKGKKIDQETHDELLAALEESQR